MPIFELTGKKASQLLYVKNDVGPSFLSGQLTGCLCMTEHTVDPH